MSDDSLLKKVLRNIALHLSVAWVLLFWIAVFAFGGNIVKSSTDWGTFLVASILTIKWLPNTVDGVGNQWREGHHRLAVGLNLIFLGLVAQQLWVIYLVHEGNEAIRLDSTISGFIKSIILAGGLLCLSAEASAQEFVTQRRWYYNVALVVGGVMIGMAIMRVIGG